MMDKKKVIFLTIDRDIDRRIIQHAKIWKEFDFEVVIYALTFTDKDFLQQLDDITIKRLSLKNSKNILFKIYYILKSLISIFKGNKKVDTITEKDSKNFVNIIIKKIPIFSKIVSFLKKFSNPLHYSDIFIKKVNENRVDYIVANDLPVLYAGIYLKKKYNSFLIYDSHEFYPEQISFSKKLTKKLKFVENKLIKEVNLIFTVNDSIAKLLKREYNFKKEVFVFYNAIDYKDILPDKNYIKDKLKLNEKDYILLYQGYIIDFRNLDKLIYIFSEIKDKFIKLVFLGNGYYKNYLISLADKLKLLNKTVFFIDAVSQDKLLYYTKSATAGVIPYPDIDINSYYCTPNKLFEFISSKLPIIANDLPELRKFVSYNGFGINIDFKKSYSELAKEIVEFFEKKKFFKYKNNLEKNFYKFSWQVEKEKIIKIYKDIDIF